MSHAGADAVLPPAVLRNLADKLYEKRKSAALEVEQVNPKQTRPAPKSIFDWDREETV